MSIKFYRARDLVGTAKSRRQGEKGILGTSPAWLWRRVQRGEFPAPVKLSDGVTAFPVHQVDAWMASRRGRVLSVGQTLPAKPGRGQR